MQSITVNKGQWCVYLHHTNWNVFYVGMGSISRAFSFCDRNEIWREYVNKHKSFEVVILGCFDNRSDAAKVEFKNIKKFSPPANINHTEPIERKLASVNC